MTSSAMLTLMRLRNFYLIELIMLLNYVVLFEQGPYLLKKQLNHGFQVRFMQIRKKAKLLFTCSLEIL